MYTFDNAKFRVLLTAKSWSLAGIARELNSPVSTISGWANGRHQPAYGNSERLAALLDCPVEDLWLAITDTTAGLTGAVALTQSQALVLAVAVALVSQDAEALALDWRHRLSASENTVLTQHLILSPQWVWAWHKLQKLARPSHPLEGYTVQAKLVCPSKGGHHGHS
jgi:transcriptional regulator with XRE-family HTH domain